MDRRNFFKIVSSVSAGAASVACKKEKSNDLIPLLVPDHEIVPGEEQWHTSNCTSCDAGCGITVRIMRGERVITRNGQQFREPIACVKKIEGNPDDPISGGRLCARGQAALQSLYNPDRLQGPMRRTGERGKATFTSITWDEAIATVAEKLGKVHAANPNKILFLTSPQSTPRTENIRQFLQSLGAPPPASCSLASHSLERKAAALFFGWQSVPHYDIANARYVLGVGADFIGSWISPVYYARQYGHFRQGRPGVRGKLVQAESRMSLTAANADEWLPLQPGSEPQFLAAITKILFDAQLPEANLADLIRATGIPEKRVRRIAQELHESEAPLVIAGASLPQSNSLDALIVAHHLNSLLGNINKPGGVQPPNTPPISIAPVESLEAQILFLDGTQNPAYTQQAAQSLSNIETIVSFGNFIDDSSAFADLLLPDNHPLESISVVRPLYNTMALEQTLSAIAQKLNLTPPNAAAETKLTPTNPKITCTAAVFSGDATQFPLHFQPYLSLQYHDGRDANLPWMQELPDPTSSAMWSVPIEIDPQTAAKLKLSNGNWVRAESPHGSIDAQVYVHPAAIPGVVSMAIGHGHSNYGRYASGRGANPLAILDPALPLGATRIRLTSSDRKGIELTQFSPSDREQGPWGYR